MTLQIQYIIQTLFNYGLVFMVAYVTLLISKSHLIKNQKIGNWIGGLGIAFALFVVIMMMDLLNLKGLPDGRYLLTAYVSFFYGFGPGLLVVLFGTFMTVSHSMDLIVGMALALLLQVLVFSFIKSRLKDTFLKLKLRYQVLGVILSSSLGIVTGLILFRNQEAMGSVVDAMPYIYIISIFMMTGLTQATLREFNRIKTLEDLKESKNDLMAQNFELQALYEEMAAAEETLRDNYDSLNLYKEKVEHYAFRNSQTGFYNKDYLVEVLMRKLDHVPFQNMRLVMINISKMDHYFKTLGQTLVEVMNYQVGIAINTAFDALSFGNIYSLSSGSYGVLFSEDVSEENIEVQLAGLRTTLGKTVLIENLELQIRISVGGVNVNSNHVESKEWLEFAEIAAVSAERKNQNESIEWFTSTMYDEKQLNIHMETGIRQAIDKNELYMCYQPQVDGMGNLKGLEALIRWRKGDQGLVSPAVFIPMAEQMGYIENIGAFTLESALEMLKRLEREGHREIPISINVSFLELMNPNFTKFVLESIKQHEVEKEMLHLEITETAISDAYDTVIQNINDLTQSGIHFHLDDFGTGYSSINHLMLFDISFLKIDKSFVDAVVHSEKMRSLLELIIQYAHRLNIEIIAEGVETKYQADWLIQNGCDYFQGYYFSKPIDSYLLNDWITDHKAKRGTHS